MAPSDFSGSYFLGARAAPVDGKKKDMVYRPRDPYESDSSPCAPPAHSHIHLQKLASLNVNLIMKNSSPAPSKKNTGINL
jgi:hypothetical protein